MKAFLKIVLGASILFSGCGIPKDPEASFRNAQHQTLKVGIVNNPPFTVISGEEYSGIEVNLVRTFATRNNLKLDFTEGCESNLIRQLEHDQIDILIGGFDKKTVWTEKAGNTIPYDGKHIILVTKGENRLVFELESVIHQYRKS